MKTNAPTCRRSLLQCAAVGACSLSVYWRRWPEKTNPPLPQENICGAFCSRSFASPSAESRGVAAARVTAPESGENRLSTIPSERRGVRKSRKPAERQGRLGTAFENVDAGRGGGNPGGCNRQGGTTSPAEIITNEQTWQSTAVASVAVGT